MIRDVQIQSVSQYVKLIERECDGDHVLFRGQSEDRKLLPKLMRLRCKTNIVEAEQDMFAEFHRRALPLLQSRPETEWDWLALAQHHGMATRLLDWTINPLAALWFTVERPPTPRSRGGVIWFFTANTEDFVEDEKSSPFSIKQVKVFRPRHVTRRIVAQSGWFTAHPVTGNAPQTLDRNSRFAKRLRKLKVPTKAFSDIRRDLDRFGVNAAAIFGDIEGLCRRLEWVNCFLDDEDS